MSDEPLPPDIHSLAKRIAEIERRLDALTRGMEKADEPAPRKAGFWT